MSIRKSQVLIIIDSIIEHEFFPFIILGILALLVVILGYRVYRNKYQHSGINRLLFSSSEQFLRSTYHKVIIGLENVKIELLPASQVAPELSQARESEITVISDVYPPDIQNDFKKNIKGRSVLLLIEIAFQPLENSHISFLIQVLNIPQSTVSDEINKLVSLEYIKTVVTSTTLKDIRYRYYSLTHKGYLFLLLLKESLTTSLTKIRQNPSEYADIMKK